jgi:sulfate transport system substrate-binding protein
LWGSGGPGGGGGGGGGASNPLAALAAAAEPVVLTLASFAVTKLAYVRLTRRFREHYLATAGVDVRFRLTFAGSGVQARAVIDGLPADIVCLALPLDVQKIADAGLVRPDWRGRYPANSTVCETTVAMVVRAGNPKRILDWPDLVREGVQVVVANPKTAGVARWIFLALWGHAMGRGEAAAIDYVTRVFGNVVVQPRDAREASDVFYRQKAGDVLLTYENEAVLINEVYGSKALPYVVPPRNIRIECPVSLVDRVLESSSAATRRAADEFARFLFTLEAQREFSRVGFRPNAALSKAASDPRVLAMPPVKMWSVDKELGGWDAAQARFFDAGKILDAIQSAVGVRKMEQRRAGKS